MTSIGTLAPVVSTDDISITVRVALRFARIGGRKLMIARDGKASAMRPTPAVTSALIKAIARAFRWREMLESGTHATVAEIAKAEGINNSYICRVLRLTLLAPDLVEAILDGRQPGQLQLADLLKPFPDRWEAQRALAATGAPQGSHAV